MKQYKKMIENLHEAIYVCDSSGRILFFNKAASELWGREPEPGEDLCCGSYMIINEGGTELPRDKFPMAIIMKEDKQLNKRAITIRRHDGSLRHVHVVSESIFNIDGKLTGTVNMVVDVTGNKIQEFEE